jgi:hypothetical protein
VRVVVLGTDAVTIDGDVPRESAGVSLEQLLAMRPDAAVIADSGERAFFRASVALERGVARVIVRPGSIEEAWMGELAARAAALGGEVFVRDERYMRLRPGPRVEVAAPSLAEDATPATRGEPMPLIARESLRCEEIAFAVGLKPVLYLVESKAAVEDLRARYGTLVARDDRLTEAARSGERSYGSGDEVSHVFIGEQAERAAELWAMGSSQNVEELGALMGYPACCVRAFAAMASRRVNAAFPYVTAARTRALGAEFNMLLDVSTERLIPFVPCTYGCSRATAWAARVAAAGGQKRSPRVVVYFDEASAVILLDTQIEGDTVRYNEARWAAAPDDRLQRAYGGVFGSCGVVASSDGLAVNGIKLARGVVLPFAAGAFEADSATLDAR